MQRGSNGSTESHVVGGHTHSVAVLRRHSVVTLRLRLFSPPLSRSLVVRSQNYSEFILPKLQITEKMWCVHAGMQIAACCLWHRAPRPCAVRLRGGGSVGTAASLFGAVCRVWGDGADVIEAPASEAMPGSHTLHATDSPVCSSSSQVARRRLSPSGGGQTFTTVSFVQMREWQETDDQREWFK